MLLNFIILFLFFLLVINIKKKVYNTTIIEISTKYKHRTIYKNIENHFIVFHVKNRNNINISQTQYFIEHNSKYDDILFLIPLYNILIKSKIIIICDDIIHRRNRIKLYFKVNNYTTYNNCIYFNISFLKYLHIHSNIFRFCKRLGGDNI